MPCLADQGWPGRRAAFFHARQRRAGNLSLKLRAHTGRNLRHRTRLAIVTLTSETSSDLAARRARMLARQARVGILRNPNSPPRPPQRKARLTGKWTNLQSSRRPQAQPDAAIAAPILTDTDLARMMKEQPIPPGTGPASTDDETGSAAATASAEVIAPLRQSAPPPGSAPPQPRHPGDAMRARVVVTGLVALFALTLLAAIL